MYGILSTLCSLLSIHLHFFLRITQVQTQTLNTYAHSPLWTHVRKPYPYEHLWGTEPTDLEIHKVTTGASQSTATSPTTESIVPLNPRINQEKFKYLCQVEDLEPGWAGSTTKNPINLSMISLRKKMFLKTKVSNIPLHYFALVASSKWSCEKISGK